MFYKCLKCRTASSCNGFAGPRYDADLVCATQHKGVSRSDWTSTPKGLQKASKRPPKGLQSSQDSGALTTWLILADPGYEVGEIHDSAADHAMQRLLIDALTSHGGIHGLGIYEPDGLTGSWQDWQVLSTSEIIWVHLTGLASKYTVQVWSRAKREWCEKDPVDLVASRQMCLLISLDISWSITGKVRKIPKGVPWDLDRGAQVPTIPGASAVWRGWCVCTTGSYSTETWRWQNPMPLSGAKRLSKRNNRRHQP